MLPSGGWSGIKRDTIHLRLVKGNEARFISHLDLMRALERSVRRAELPVAYTEGFNPHMRISFATALPVGATSEGELVEVVITSPMDPEEFRQRLNEHLPLGISIAASGHITGLRGSLADAVEWAEYWLNIRYEGEAPEFQWKDTVASFLEASHVEVEREGRDGSVKKVDIRPLVRMLEVGELSPRKGEIHAIMKAGSRKNVRAEDLCKGFSAVSGDGPFVPLAVHRVRLYGEEGGELIPLDRDLIPQPTGGAGVERAGLPVQNVGGTA